MSTVGPMGQLWTRRGVSERNRWWSRANSALGAGMVLLNLSVFSHANRNCEVGQRLKGPAAPVAAALWFLAEAPACGPYMGSDIAESFLMTNPDLHPHPNLRRRSSKPVPSPAHLAEVNSTAQVVCSKAEHTGLVAESLSMTTPNPHPSLQIWARTPTLVPIPTPSAEANLTAQVVCSEAEHTGPVVKAFRQPPQICTRAPKCGHVLLPSYPV